MTARPELVVPHVFFSATGRVDVQLHDCVEADVHAWADALGMTDAPQVYDRKLGNLSVEQNGYEVIGYSVVPVHAPAGTAAE